MSENIQHTCLEDVCVSDLQWGDLVYRFPYTDIYLPGYKILDVLRVSPGKLKIEYFDAFRNQFRYVEVESTYRFTRVTRPHQPEDPLENSKFNDFIEKIKTQYLQIDDFNAVEDGKILTVDNKSSLLFTIFKTKKKATGTVKVHRKLKNSWTVIAKREPLTTHPQANTAFPVVFVDLGDLVFVTLEDRGSVWTEVVRAPYVSAKNWDIVKVDLKHNNDVVTLDLYSYKDFDYVVPKDEERTEDKMRNKDKVTVGSDAALEDGWVKAKDVKIGSEVNFAGIYLWVVAVTMCFNKAEDEAQVELVLALDVETEEDLSQNRIRVLLPKDREILVGPSCFE